METGNVTIGRKDPSVGALWGLELSFHFTLPLRDRFSTAVKKIKYFTVTVKIMNNNSLRELLALLVVGSLITV